MDMTESVAVLGSLHMDLLVGAGRLPVLGETLIGGDWHQTAGGKGLNQAVACALAGARVTMFGAVGADGFGNALIDHLHKHRVSADGVNQVNGQRSGISIVVQTHDDYAAVVSSQVNATLSAETVLRWASKLSQCDNLVLQNEIPEEANIAAAAMVRRNGGRVILNAAPARILSKPLLNEVSVLVVNAVEAEMMGASPVADLASASRACEAIQKAIGCAVIVTAGPHGAAWKDASGSLQSVAGERVQVVSSHGAGDTFIGHLVAALSRGETLSAAVCAANRHAAAFVSAPREGRKLEVAG